MTCENNSLSLQQNAQRVATLAPSMIMMLALHYSCPFQSNSYCQPAISNTILCSWFTSYSTCQPTRAVSNFRNLQDATIFLPRLDVKWYEDHLILPKGVMKHRSTLWDWWPWCSWGLGGGLWGWGDGRDWYRIHGHIPRGGGRICVKKRQIFVD